MAPASTISGENAGQAVYWASRAVQKWVDHQQKLDQLFTGVTEVLFEAANLAPRQRVLDLGCGTGAMTLALAEKVGPGGEVVALDISAPLLEMAQERAAAAGLGNIRFVEADAQTFTFESGSFDLIISRFGAMFFSDPVAAFQNMRSALRPGGALHLAAWGPVNENLWFTIPRDAAIARLGPAPKGPPNEPGPLAFSDRDYVLGILSDAGFAAAAAEAVAVELTAPNTPDAAGELAVSVGPASRIISANKGTADDTAVITAETTADLMTYQTASGILVPAVINLFSARNP